MLKKLLLCVTVLVASVTSLYAQTGSVSGTVYDQRTEETLPGVNIFVSDVSRGAATDIDGNYTISDLPYGEYQVRVSFVGYKEINQTVTIDEPEQTLDFYMEEDLVGLDEVIVTGQGSGVERRRLSTNVSSVSAKQIERLPTIQMDQILQANIPNAQVRMSSGAPGTASLIRGRGVTSALSSTTPVIYIDGVRVDNTSAFALASETGGAESSALADIPVENIERIEVLSGGAATTQFGSDAANGVIQIFTKKGVEGRSTITFQSQIGAEVATKDYLKWEESGDILFEPGLTQQYQLSASGGTETFNYSFSGSMRGEEGTLVAGGDGSVRHNLRASFGAELSEYVTYNTTFGFTSNEYDRKSNANFSGGILDIEGGGFGDPSTWDNETFEYYDDFINEYISLQNIEENVKRFQTSNSLNFTFSDNLTAKALVGLDYRSSGQTLVETNEYYIARGFISPGTTDQGYMTEQDRDYLGVTVEASGQHRFDTENFSFVTNFGGQLFRDDERQLRAVSNGLPDGSYMVDTGSQTSAENYYRTVVNYGVYLLENISFNDVYVLDLGIRADQNTAFGEEVGVQFYPKAGLVYNVSSESFFQENVPSNILSTFRLRASYGMTGNFPRPFSNEVLASVGSYLGGSYIDFGNPGDPNLKPEKTTTIEVGTDLGFANDRINFEVAYYTAETNDALFDAPFARSVGLGNTLQNLGTIENSGFEVNGRFNVFSSRDASVNLRASFNTLNNEVVSNGGSAPFSLGGFSFLGSWVDEGQPVGYFRGGKPVFDDNGDLVETIPATDLGSPLPDYFGNIGINADYKNFTLTTTADWQVGAQAVWPDEVLRWASGLGDDRTKLTAAQGYSFFDLAGIWVEDADYLKVRLISLNYQVPESLYSGLVRSISVGATATNPFNFVSSNFDPEVTGAGIADGQGGVGVGGFSYRTLSPPRQFYGTVRIDF